MNHPERPAEVPHETWMEPRETGAPAIRLVHEGGRYRADFSLELAGVAHMTETPQPVLATWPPVLTPRQTVEIVQQVHDGETRCTVLGSSHAECDAQALDSAQDLWHNLSIALGRESYRFSANTEPPGLEQAPHGWQAWIQPLGLEIRRARPVGYQQTGDAADSIIRLSHPAVSTPTHLDALARAAAFCRTPVQLVLSLQPVQLDARTQQIILQLIAASGAGLQVTYPDSTARILDDNVLQALQRDLETWSHYPFGTRISCRVMAEEPVADTLLAHIGTEVFSGRPIRWSKVLPAASGAIDLSAVVPADGLLPPCFPSAALLVDQGMPRHFPTSRPRLPGSGITLGTLDGHHSVRFTTEDRARHCYILGATGTGKSTLLLRMLKQDIERDAGVCLLDPHGDLVEQVLDVIPPRRIGDVILIEPDHPKLVVGLNFLECTGPRPQLQMNFITNELIKIFHRLYDLDRAGGPIFEQYMRNALLLVMDNTRPGGTLMDIPLLFEDKEFRINLLKTCQNPYTVNFWRHQAHRTTGDSGLNNMAPYITSKLNQFTHNALLRPIIGQSSSTVDFRRCMDEGRIVLIKLAKGVLGELDAHLLGMLIIGKLFNTALQRADMPPEKRRPFYLYVDEAHNFTTDTVAHLLAEARKFGLHLTLANQNLAQVSDTRDAILGNVGSLLLFRLGAIDAEQMASYVKPELTTSDLEDLPDRHVVSRLLVHGRPTRPFLFRTESLDRWPSRTGAARRAMDYTLASHQCRYTRPIAEVEAELQARFSCKRSDTLGFELPLTISLWDTESEATEVRLFPRCT